MKTWITPSPLAPKGKVAVPHILFGKPIQFAGIDLQEVRSSPNLKPTRCGNCLGCIYGSFQGTGIDSIYPLLFKQRSDPVCLFATYLVQLSIAASPLNPPVPVSGSLAMSYQYQLHPLNSPPVLAWYGGWRVDAASGPGQPGLCPVCPY